MCSLLLDGQFPASHQFTSYNKKSENAIQVGLNIRLIVSIGFRVKNVPSLSCIWRKKTLSPKLYTALTIMHHFSLYIAEP